MTNGLVSIVDTKGTVRYKLVAGCDGYNALRVAEELCKEQPVDPETIYDIAIDQDFGCDDCLVLQASPSDGIFKGDHDLPEWYESKFYDPKFNPRWESGIVGYLVIIQVDGNKWEIIEKPEEDE